MSKFLVFGLVLLIFAMGVYGVAISSPSRLLIVNSPCYFLTANINGTSALHYNPLALSGGENIDFWVDARDSEQSQLNLNVSLFYQVNNTLGSFINISMVYNSGNLTWNTNISQPLGNVMLAYVNCFDGFVNTRSPSNGTESIRWTANVGPIVTRISPPSSTSFTVGTLSFQFNSTDNVTLMESCTMYRNGSNASYLLNVAANFTATMNITAHPVGNWSWNITCLNGAFLGNSTTGTYMVVPVNAPILGGAYSGSSARYAVSGNSGTSSEFIFGTGSVVQKLLLSFNKGMNAPSVTLTTKPDVEAVKSLQSVYDYFDVLNTNFDESTITSATFDFTVDNSWTEKNPGNIHLYHFNGKTWDRLPTQNVKTEGSKTHYRATGQLLSTFAIANGENNPAITASSTIKTSILVGFLLGAIILVQGSTYVYTNLSRLNKKKKQE